MKNIVITGANRGIGLALTKLFSKDHYIYAVCRSEFPESELNENIQVVTLDITHEAAIRGFAKTLDDAETPIDLLINNAGMAGGDMTADGEEQVRLDMKSLVEVFTVNTVGPMTLTLQLTSALKRATHPAMIAISSRMASHELLNDYNAEWWPYSSSKAALSMAVSAFAINEPSIQSISVHPGWVQTRMGGDDADISPEESAKGIYGLYEQISQLQSGSLYNYDGKLMGW